jgi:hypothetical protein
VLWGQIQRTSVRSRYHQGRGGRGVCRELSRSLRVVVDRSTFGLPRPRICERAIRSPRVTCSISP